MKDLATLIDRIEAALVFAYAGSAETGSFLRGSGAELVPSVFLTLNQLRDAVRPMEADASPANPCGMCGGTGVARPISQAEQDEAFRSLEDVERMLGVSPAKDPIADAVHSELAPLADALIEAGHKLAKNVAVDDLTDEQRAYFERHCGDGCRGCPYCMRPSDGPPEAEAPASPKEPRDA